MAVSNESAGTPHLKRVAAWMVARFDRAYAALLCFCAKSFLSAARARLVAGTSKASFQSSAGIRRRKGRPFAVLLFVLHDDARVGVLPFRFE